jgi:hypothetical protein
VTQSTLAAWQKGYPLEQLKAFAELFRECHKQFVFGAFGLLKERDVASALSERKLIYTLGDRPAAAALFFVTKVPTVQHDFAQRRIEIPPRTLVIKSLAVRDKSEGRRMLGTLLQRSRDLSYPIGNHQVWCEIFEEDATAKALMADYEFTYVATKVAASSDLKGVYVRGRVSPLPPPDQLEVPSVIGLPGELLDKAEQKIIREELTFYESDPKIWEQHYSSYNKRQSWTAFSLRGFKPEDPGFIIKPAEMSKQWKEENHDLLENVCEATPAAEFFPKTLQIIERYLPQKKERVRFMRLAPGGELTRHADITDREAGTREGKIMRMHIPIVTNPDCLFRTMGLRGDGHETHFKERGLYYLDTRKPHAVKNGGSVARIHLVIDTVSDERLRGRLEAIA